MLQHHDLLMTIAQVSATFAGFSGVIGIFRRGSSLSELEIGALQVRAVVELGVLATGFALLPFVPDGFGVPAAVTWRLCSAIAGVAFFGGFVGAMRRFRASTGEVAVGAIARDPLLVGIALTVVGASQIVLWLNVLGVTSGAAATLYVVALLLALAHAGFMFVRLLTPRK
jgi:hypothetical protein